MYTSAKVWSVKKKPVDIIQRILNDTFTCLRILSLQTKTKRPLRWFLIRICVLLNFFFVHDNWDHNKVHPFIKVSIFGESLAYKFLILEKSYVTSKQNSIFISICKGSSFFASLPWLVHIKGFYQKINCFDFICSRNKCIAIHILYIKLWNQNLNEKKIIFNTNEFV